LCLADPGVFWHSQTRSGRLVDQAVELLSNRPRERIAFADKQRETKLKVKANVIRGGTPVAKPVNPLSVTDVDGRPRSDRIMSYAD